MEGRHYQILLWAFCVLTYSKMLFQLIALNLILRFSRLARSAQHEAQSSILCSKCFIDLMLAYIPFAGIFALLQKYSYYKILAKYFIRLTSFFQNVLY